MTFPTYFLKRTANKALPQQGRNLTRRLSYAFHMVIKVHFYNFSTTPRLWFLSLPTEFPDFIHFETDSCKPYMSVLYWPRQKTFDFPLPLWSIIQGSESAILQNSEPIKCDQTHQILVGGWTATISKIPYRRQTQFVKSWSAMPGMAKIPGISQES